MTERGMIFNAEMVRAILDGRKTQTRRIIKDQPESSEFGLRYISESSLAKEVGMYFWSQSDASGVKSRSNPFACPYGKPGDRIWVRETFNGFWVTDEEIEEIQEGISKAADLCDYKADYPDNSQPAEGWTPSIHMPRWASRITLEITSIRVERLRSMSQEDARAEGVIAASGPMEAGLAFRELWDSIYGPDSWQANPWVWVIEFKPM